MLPEHFIIVFIILVLLTAVYFPVSGYYAIKSLKKSIQAGELHRKIKFYYSNIFWLWLPVIIVFIWILATNINFQNIGFRRIDLNAVRLSKWIIYPGIGLYILHLVYNLYLIKVISTNKEARIKVAESTSNEFKYLLPITLKEKKAWTLVSVTAGITEEVFYRGYLFFALAELFTLSQFSVLLISTAIFGIGHIYLGKEGIKSAFLGFLFGIYYLLFNSIIPVIIIHIIQDLVVRNILKEED